MARQLPAQPNVEFLRKEAKARRRATPGLQLADAQHALANEYGFATWAKLKAHVEALTLPPAEALTAAIHAQDAAAVRAVLDRHRGLRAGIDNLYAAVQRSDRATIDVLLAAGAGVRQRTERGFGVLDECHPSLAAFLIERGAVLDAHSAARLGPVEKLRELLVDPDAPGADGRTPLHFASTVEIAETLLDRGAAIDALDRRHESTPAQHMLRVEHLRHYPRDRQDVARYLVSRGCRTDLLMAAALGDTDLARRHLDAAPGSIRMKVSEEWFSPHTIYRDLLGPGRTAHAVARDFGHEELFRLLLERTPRDLRLALACELGDEATFREYLAQLPAAIPEADLGKLPDAAQSNNAAAVRLMLEAGWPVDTPGAMGATALHWAGYNGNAEMTRTILRFHPSLELQSRENPGTALSWAVYGSGNGWHRDSGDFPATVRALLDAGAQTSPMLEELEPSDAVLELLP
jgi:ankyrin repeat protein